MSQAPKWSNMRVQRDRKRNVQCMQRCRPGPDPDHLLKMWKKKTLLIAEKSWKQSSCSFLELFNFKSSVFISLQNNPVWGQRCDNVTLMTLEQLEHRAHQSGLISSQRRSWEKFARKRQLLSQIFQPSSDTRGVSVTCHVTRVTRGPGHYHCHAVSLLISSLRSQLSELCW